MMQTESRNAIKAGRARWRFLALSMLLVVSLVFGSAILTKDAYASSTTRLLSDGFDQGLANWVNTANALVSSSQLTLTNNELMRSAVGGASWTDYTFITDVTITSGAAGIVFRSQDDNNYYMWQLSAGGSLRPHKKVNGSWTIIKDVPLGLTTGSTYRVMLEVKGSTIRTFINGGLIDTTTDATFSSGKVGFRQGQGETANFDNMMVTEGGLLLSDDFGGAITNNWNNTDNATASGSQLTLSSNETMRSKVGDSSWTNYVIDEDVKVTSGAAGIVFRSQDDNNYYMWQLSSGGDLRPHKKVNGVWTLIKDVQLGLALNTTYHVQIDVNGSTIRTFINGGLIDTTTDSQFAWGKVGFRQSQGESAVFDNLYVSGSTDSPVPTPTPTPTPPPGSVVVPAPILKYSFESDTLAGPIHDDSANNRNGAIANNGGLSLPAGRFALGKGLQSAGGDLNYVTTPAIGNMTDTTIAFWYKAEDLYSHSNTTIFDTGSAPGTFKLTFNNIGNLNDNTRQTMFTFQVHGNQGGDYNYGNGAQTGYTRFGEHDSYFYGQQPSWTKHLLEHNWVHLAIVYQPQSKKVTFYMNGKLDSTKTFSTAVNPTFDAGRLMASFVPGESFKGTLDDFTVYNQALSSEQVSQIGNFENDLWANRTADAWQQPSTVIYVDGTNGNDANIGSQASPVRSIGAGLGKITGDSTKLVIQPGTYYEHNLSLNKSGTELRPIIMEAAQAGTVFIDGSDLSQNWSNGWTAIGGNTYTHYWPYSNWGLSSQPDDSLAPSNDQNNHIGDIARSREEVIANFGSGDVVLQPTTTQAAMSGTNNSFYVNKGSNTIYMHVNQAPGSGIIRVPVYDRLFDANNVQYFIMRGLTFQTANPYLFDPAVNFNWSKHILIEDCTFRTIGGTPLFTPDSGDVGSQMSEDFVIRRYQGLDNGRDGIHLGYRMMNVLVEDAYILRNGWRYDWSNYTGADPSAVGKNMFTKNITYRRISVRDNVIRGLWFDNANWNTSLLDSYVRLNKQGGMWIEINPQGVDVRNSAFSENIDEGLNITNSEGVILDNNIVYQNQTSPYWGILSSWEPNQYRDADGIRPGTNLPWNLGGPNYYTHNTKLTNNYIVGGAAGLNVVKWPNWPAVLYPTMTSANNKFYAAGGDNVFNLDNSMTNWAGWRSHLPQDTTSTWLASDPFADDGSVTVGFAQPTSTWKWSNRPLNIPVVLSKPVNKVIKVDYTVTSGSAQAGTDYVIKSGQLFFNPLQREDDIKIVIVKDGSAKPDKNFVITLTGPNGALLGTQTTNTVTISGN